MARGSTSAIASSDGKVAPMTELLTARMVAALAGTTQRTVNRAAVTGRLPVAQDLGRGLPKLFRREDAEAFVAWWQDRRL